MRKEEYIYLDHAASTPVHPDVIAAMIPYWNEVYGNPSSSHHYGRLAEHALEESRRQIADLINALPNEIIFTGCGSESDNLAIRGVMESNRVTGVQKNNNVKNHLIVSAIEHTAVLNTAKQLRDHFGFELTILPVDKNGQIDLIELEDAIRPTTVLISIMAANNEIGTMQPILDIGEIAHAHGVLFHTDAIQAAAVMRWDMAKMPIDLMSIAPHKFYGPKGIGILFARHGIELVSTLTGGGQEDGRRAGTSNVAFAVGAAKAFQLAMNETSERNDHYRALRDRLIEGITKNLPGECILTGHPTDRLPNNASFAFQDISGNDLLMHLDMASIAASSGSACKVGDPKPSATLQAIGLSEEWTKGGLRLTVGTQNSMADVEYVVDKLPGFVQKLRQLNHISV